MKSSSSLRRLGAMLVVLCFAAAALSTPAARGAEDAKSRIDRMFHDAGYTVKRINDSVWTVEFTGNSMAKIKVISGLSDSSDLLVVFAILASHGNYRDNSVDFLTKIARYNHTYDRIKVGIDGDGDLFVRVDLSVRILDARELKLNVDQVRDASDEVYGGIKSYILR